MERDRTIQMKMPGEWLDFAENEAKLLFGGNRSEMVRFSVLLLHYLRTTNFQEYLRLRAELPDAEPASLEVIAS